MVRYNAHRTLDTTFSVNNDGGQVTTNFNNGDDFGQSVTLDSSRNVFVAGQAFGTNVADGHTQDRLVAPCPDLFLPRSLMRFDAESGAVLNWRGRKRAM